MCAKLSNIEEYLDFKLEHKLGVFEVGRIIINKRGQRIIMRSFMNLNMILIRKIK